MWRIVFIVGFFVVTILPGLQLLTGLAPLPPVEENRKLAPTVSKATPIDQVPRVADRWFTDHFGFRSLLIQLKTQIDFSVFKMSDRVLVGRNGQLFYRSVVDVEEPAMEELLKTEEAPAVENFAKLTDARGKSGVHVALIVNMLSDWFYPELLHRAATHRAAARIDDLATKLSATPGVMFIDSTGILRRTMAERRIFHKTDFHWNDPAAFEVAKVLVDRMSQEEGHATSNWAQTLTIDTEQTSGGIAMFMPLFVPPSETALKVRQTWNWPPGFALALNQGPFEIITHATPDPKLLSPIVFVGDSFIDGMMRSGIQADFVETHRVRWTPNLKISDIVSSLPPDTKWLVFQFIEVSQTAVRGFADKNDIELSLKILRDRQAAAKASETSGKVP